MSARAKGVILLIVGIVLLLISRTLLGANDVNGLFLFSKEPEMQ